MRATRRDSLTSHNLARGRRGENNKFRTAVTLKIRNITTQHPAKHCATERERERERETERERKPTTG